MELKDMQERVYQNKIKHGFNTTNVPLEFLEENKDINGFDVMIQEIKI